MRHQSAGVPPIARRVSDAAVDVALATVVLAAGLVQLGTQNFAELGPAKPPAELPTEADPLGFLLVLLSALPLLARRRHALAGLAVTCAASVAVVALEYGVIVHLAPAVALFTLAAQLPRPRLALVAAVAVAAFATIAILEWMLLDARGDFAIDGLVWVGGWIAGERRRLARQHRLDLHDRAERAEREAERERRLAAAEERARLARELHDSAGHAINTILAHAGAARVLRAHDPERADAAIATVELLARETIDEIDHIVGALRQDDDLETVPLPGLIQIEELAERQRSGGLEVTLTRTGDPRKLRPAVDRAAYRIVQEAVTNAARHGTGRIHVQVHFGPHALALTTSNPVGPDSSPRPGGGRGLTGMRERASLLGGTFSAATDGDRFRVHASLPYDREQT